MNSKVAQTHEKSVLSQHALIIIATGTALQKL